MYYIFLYTRLRNILTTSFRN